MDNNLTEIYEDLKNRFDLQEDFVKVLSNYVFIESDGPDKNKLVSSIYTLSHTKKDYIKIILTTRDGSRTYDSKPDSTTIEIFLILDGGVINSKKYGVQF